MTMTPIIILWVCLGVFTLALALYRKILSAKEDDYLHIADGEAKLIPQQAELARKLDWIDKVGETLTVITVVFGLALGGAYLYQIWKASGN
jgi:hypothetical protein